MLGSKQFTRRNMAPEKVRTRGDSVGYPAGTDVRLFVAPTVRAALTKVRDALGADAFILEQRSVDGGVEVLACRDMPQPEPVKPKAHYGELLEQAGFDKRLAEELAAQAENWPTLVAALGSLVPCAPPSQPLSGRYRLVGPCGAGKTTSIVKLMASRVLRYGNSGALLVGTDRRRLSGCEQLATSAELLGVEYLECSEQELPLVLKRWHHFQLILVDSTGIDRAQQPAAVPGLSDLLTLPVMWHGAALQRLRSQLAGYPLEGVVLTHVDQAQVLGHCASILADWRLPVWWLSEGPDLSVELDEATPGILAGCFQRGIDRLPAAAMFDEYSESPR